MSTSKQTSAERDESRADTDAEPESRVLGDDELDAVQGGYATFCFSGDGGASFDSRSRSSTTDD
jgi:hypothetical protein